MYSLAEYGHMIADEARFGAYANVISCVVRPGDAVLDLGCGPGVLSLLACRAGARRVYAIELGDSLDMARQLAAANGSADRIVFLAGDSRKLELPERVRVIVSDLRGILPLFGGAVPSLADARKRFLEPGGVLIPQRDTLYAAVVEADATYAKITLPWSSDVKGLNLLPGREPLLHSTQGMDCKLEQLLTEPEPWALLDYASGANARPGSVLALRAVRAGTAHGLCVWFDAQLWGEHRFSSGPLAAPGARATVYGQMFLPWLAPVALVQGQEVTVELHADLVGEDYVWRWNTSVAPAGAGEPVRFVQSSFWGAGLSQDALRRRALDYVPVLTQSGEADRWLLEGMDGEHSLEEMARAGAERFPREFPSFEEALRRLMSLAEKYAR